MGHERLKSLGGGLPWLALAAFLSACASSPESTPTENVAEARSRAFSNGDFETGAANAPPPSWTVTPFLDPGVTIQTPQTRAGLNLAAGGVAKTFTLNAPGGPESQVGSSLGAGASLRWPKYGNKVVIVNQLGTQKNVNSLSQTMTVVQSDVDPLDNLVHVRFVVAPVLENPNHQPDQQPYYFVQLDNITRSSILYSDYNASAQPGVPWKISNGYYYTDWQLVDIAPGSAALAVGDQVKLEVIGSGCSLNAHFGHVYVDGVGSTIPGPFVSATGPAAANAGSNITYTLTYKNGGAAPLGGTTVEFNIPPNTTFQSFNAPGLSCTAPAVGAGGLVSCVVGTLPPGGSGSFTITVNIDLLATGTITAGNYDIYGTGSSPLLGPKVFTSITNGVTYADLGITVTNGQTSLVWGQSVSYTIVATNAGPNAVTGAKVTAPLPANLTAVTWTCAGAGGGTCAASGNGAINDATVALPVGAKVTYTANGTVASGSGGGSLAYIVNVAPPVLAADSNPANNSAGDIDPIQSINGVPCLINGDCVSNVCDPADHICGYKDGDGPCSQANGPVVCRSGACSPNGNICIPAGGCAVDGDCTADKWCNNGTLSCTPDLPNGTLIPTVPGHAPPLAGTCTQGAAAVVCSSGVCDVNDDRCGYATGDGPCTMADALVVCRSGACSANGTCVLPGGCNVDSDCAADKWCNISAHTCAPKIGNGGSMPIDGLHDAPTLDGNCTPDAGALVCVSAICDPIDDKCGWANGDGACTQADGGVICRAAVCDPDGKCGFANSDGPCTQGNAHVVCRSGACSVNGAVCVPVGGCAVDADCGASEWCNNVTYTCKPKLPNGDAIPTVAGHAPPLTGACTPGAGSAVCSSDVCDAADNLCGFANGDGPCTQANGAVVCRSGSCSAAGVCQPATACNADADCDVATSYCDTGVHLCAPKLPNGDAIPTVAGHTPVLDGKCSDAEAIVVCQSAVCDTNDDKCGYANGDGPCTAVDAGTVCRSSTCSPNGLVCVPSGGCAVDADCASTQWCNTVSFTCAPKLPNGVAVPTVAGHTPPLTGTCTPGAGSAVCASGVCDTNDNKCGYANGDGPCTMANAGVVCRAGACTPGGLCTDPTDCNVDADCDAATQYCFTPTHKCAPKLPNGELLPSVPGHSPGLDGTCSDTSAKIVCQSGVCDAADNRCGHAIGKGPCDAGNGVKVCRSEVCATMGPNQNLCVECVVDAQCFGATAVCDTTKNACVQCTTAEDTACAGTTPVCVASNDTCAPCDGDLGDGTPAACSKSGSPYCFLSGSLEGSCGKCGTNEDCAGHAAGPICDTATGACGMSCHVDADCDAASWCNAAPNGSGMCVPKLDNGVPLPGVPSNVSTCTPDVGKRVCKSGVCDKDDDKCGYPNGDGPCTDASVCRSNACDPSDKKCGLLIGNGPCSNDDACREGTCDPATQLCTGGAEGCKTDEDCPATDFCKSDGACTPKLPDGSACIRSTQCKTGACDEHVCDGIVAVGNGLLCAADPSRGSGAGSGAALFGLMLAAAGLSRRRRR